MHCFEVYWSKRRCVREARKLTRADFNLNDVRVQYVSRTSLDERGVHRYAPPLIYGIRIVRGNTLKHRDT